VQLPSKITTSVRRTIASEEPVSINQLADTIRQARQQTENDFRGNVRLLRQRFGDAVVDRAMVEVRRRLVR
jgi:hypothetical protein